MSRLCGDCPTPLERRNKTGFCRQHSAAHRGPDFRANVSAARKRKIVSDPAFLDALRVQARKLSADPAIVAARTAHFDQAIRDQGNAASMSPEARARRARSLSEVRMAWCPPEHREAARALVRKGIPAPEVRTIILAQHRTEMARFRVKLLALSA